MVVSSGLTVFPNDLLATRAEKNVFKKAQFWMVKRVSMKHIRIDGIFNTSADGFPNVEKIVNVSRFLMMNFENRPQSLHLSFAFMGLGFGFPHLLVQLFQGGFDQLPTLGGLLTGTSNLRHFLKIV
jgi:hypothetical protein